MSDLSWDFKSMLSKRNYALSSNTKIEGDPCQNVQCPGNTANG